MIHTQLYSEYIHLHSPLSDEYSQMTHKMLHE